MRDTIAESAQIIPGACLLAYTLSSAALSALAMARTYVSNHYTMLNKSTPDAWVTYLESLMAISDGTDATSTSLPTAPVT